MDEALIVALEPSHRANSDGASWLAIDDDRVQDPTEAVTQHRRLRDGAMRQ